MNRLSQSTALAFPRGDKNEPEGRRPLYVPAESRENAGASAPVAWVFTAAIHVAEPDFAAPYGPTEELTGAVLLTEAGAQKLGATPRGSQDAAAAASGLLRKIGLVFSFQWQSWQDTPAGFSCEVCGQGVLMGPQARDSYEGMKRLDQWRDWMQEKGLAALREEGVVRPESSIVWRAAQRPSATERWMWGPLLAQWEARLLGEENAISGARNAFARKNLARAARSL